MEQNNTGPCLICVGVILIVIDFTLLSWFPSLMLTFVGICLICSGISASSRYSRSKKTYAQIQKPQYNSQPTPQQIGISQAPESPIPEKPAPTNETHMFCPMCGAKATGKFCPECGSEIE